MIDAEPAKFAALAARLAKRAEAIAARHLELRRLEPSRDPRRWRRAELLWPNFTRG